MASKKPKTEGKKTRNRRPFMDRFRTKIENIDEWIQKTLPKFADAPKNDVADALTVISENLVTVAESVPKLNGWAPPARSGAFAVGDSVSFKPKKLEELVKAGVYTKNELEGEHEIVAISGRKVKLPMGLFQSLYVTKSA